MIEKDTATVESWRHVFRKGFCPVISTLGLQCLQKALQDDDPRLTQGSTTTPPPLMSVRDWSVEASDAIGFTGWQGSDLKTVGEVEEYFARCFFEADQRLGEPAACRFFLTWYDDSPREEMRLDLLEEVTAELERRETLLPPKEDSVQDALHHYELNAPLDSIRVHGSPVA